MAEQSGQACMGRLDPGAHALRTQLHTQRQGVDEHPQCPVGTLAALHPAQQHGTEHDVVLARDAAQHLCPGQVIQARRTHPELTGLGPQAPAERSIHRLADLFDPTSVALHILQAERQRRLGHIAQHLAEESFVFLAADAQSRLGHVVTVRHRGCQQMLAPHHMGFDFRREHGQGRRVIDHVMEQQHADPAIVRHVLGIADPHHRCLADVQAIMPWVQVLAQLLRDIPRRRVQHDLVEPQSSLAPDHLHRFVQPFPDHAGAQDIVAGHHALQRLGEVVQAGTTVVGELYILQIGVALGRGEVVIQDAFLQWGKGIDILNVAYTARHRGDDAIDTVLVQIDQGQHVRSDPRAVDGDEVGRHHDFAHAAYGRRQCRQRRLAEQHADVGRQVDLAHALDQLHCQQRMAAHFKEMVMTADLLHLQQLLPDPRNRRFDLALGRLVFTGHHRGLVGHRQRLAIQFAVGGQREYRQHHERAGHHVFRQGTQQFGAQFGRRRWLALVGNHIGHQALVTRGILARQDHGFTHAVAGGQLGLDLTQFDTETADLHLVIVTPEVFDTAVRQPATEVTGLVHAGVRLIAERVVEETLGGQLIAIQVTTAHTRATDVHFADHTDRYGFALCVEHIQLQVRNTFADGADTGQLGVGSTQCTVGHVYGGFGDAVHVHQLRTGIDFTGIPRLEDPGFQRLAAEDHLAQAVLQVALTLSRDQLAERARRLVEDGHPGLAQQRIAVLRGAADQLRHHQQAATVGQRAPDFPDREIEGKGMEQRPDVLRAEVEPWLGGREQPRDVTVLDHHALGQAGGAGGVDHIGQVTGLKARHVRIMPWLLLHFPGFERIEQHGRHVQWWQGFTPFPLGHQRCRAAVVQHVGDAFRRIGRVQRHVARPRLEDAQQADDHVQAALDTDRHPVVRANPLGQQAVGQLVGAGVELAVSQRLLFMDHRHGVRLGHCPGFELAMDQGVCGIFGIPGVPGFQQLPALGWRQDGQRVQRSVRRLLQGGDQAVQCHLHVATDACGTDRGVDQGREGETFPQVVDVEGQWVVGAFVAIERLDPVPGREAILGHLGGAMTVVEQGAEQRRRCRHATATLGQRQGGMFMAQQVRQSGVGRLDAGTNILGAHVHAQRQGVDEHPQRPVGPFAALHPAQQYRAEHHFLATGHFAQHLCPGQVHQAGGTDAQLPGLGPQTPGQRKIHRLADLIDAMAVPLHILQAERQRRLVDIAQHVAEECLVFRLAHAQSGLGHVVAIRHRFAQSLALPQQVQLHFMLHHIQRGMVQRHVVEQQDRQPTVLGFVPAVDQLQHRCTAQVQAIMARIEAGRQLRGDIAGRGIGFEALRLQQHFAPDHLQRFVQAFPGHAGAQDVVAVDHHLQRLDERLEALQAVEGELRLQHVGVALLGGQVVIEDTFL